MVGVDSFLAAVTNIFFKFRGKLKKNREIKKSDFEKDSVPMCTCDLCLLILAKIKVWPGPSLISVYDEILSYVSKQRGGKIFHGRIDLYAMTQIVLIMVLW